MTSNDPNLVFKVTLFFDAGYLTKDYIRPYLDRDRKRCPRFLMVSVSMTSNDLCTLISM